MRHCCVHFISEYPQILIFKKYECLDKKKAGDQEEEYVHAPPVNIAEQESQEKVVNML